MKDAMLFIHFIGLAMGVGTSFGYMFLGIASSKMEKEEGLKFTLNTFALTRMGQIGLVLLVLSGGYLMTPRWATLADTPLLIVKLFLVLILAAVIGILSSWANKARHSDAEIYLKKIAPLGRTSLLISLVIILLAVLVFH